MFESQHWKYFNNGVYVLFLSIAYDISNYFYVELTKQVTKMDTGSEESFKNNWYLFSNRHLLNYELFPLRIAPVVWFDWKNCSWCYWQKKIIIIYLV